MKVLSTPCEIHGKVLGVSLADLVLFRLSEYSSFPPLSLVLCSAAPPAFPRLGQLNLQQCWVSMGYCSRGSACTEVLLALTPGGAEQGTDLEEAGVGKHRDSDGSSSPMARGPEESGAEAGLSLKMLQACLHKELDCNTSSAGLRTGTGQYAFKSQLRASFLLCNEML